MTKILLIEDESILRSEVLDWLTLEDYEALEAADGVEGVRLAIKHLPDLIISDVTMPHLDGHGVLLELRSNPATDSIPFIFMTARASYEDVRRGMDLGADDYITKPFTRLELLQAIQTRLDKKAVLEQKRQQEIDHLEQALAEEQEQRMLKARLVAMFSHDFRNPLASVMSSSNLLRNYSDRMDPARRSEHFNRIESSVRRLMQMLDDMMVVAQMDTGKLEFSPESLDLEPFFQSIVEEFRIIQGEHASIEYDCRFRERVQADARLLRQIAYNLISNATKYSPQGSPVTVRLEGGSDYFALTVQDEGMGIPEADQARLFQAFQRASNVGGVRGTGLGLAIVKQAAGLHGGAIQLESREGKGTRICVTIPA
jgi:two-component system, sensor histidine kinase and response regulator